VRITSEVRRQVLIEHYTQRRAAQQAVVESERNDRKVHDSGLLLHSTSDLRVSNAIAVLQEIAANLAAFDDPNRDFKVVQR
jgi:hypothetical protein